MTELGFRMSFGIVLFVAALQPATAAQRAGPGDYSVINVYVHTDDHSVSEANSSTLRLYFGARALELDPAPPTRGRLSVISNHPNEPGYQIFSATEVDSATAVEITAAVGSVRNACTWDFDFPRNHFWRPRAVLVTGHLVSGGSRLIAVGFRPADPSAFLWEGPTPAIGSPCEFQSYDAALVTTPLVQRRLQLDRVGRATVDDALQHFALYLQTDAGADSGTEGVLELSMYSITDGIPLVLYSTMLPPVGLEQPAKRGGKYLFQFSLPVGSITNRQIAGVCIANRSDDAWRPSMGTLWGWGADQDGNPRGRLIAHTAYTTLTPQPWVSGQPMDGERQVSALESFCPQVYYTPPT